MPRTFRSIPLSELRELVNDPTLNDQEDVLVTFASDYGDHCHTEQVHSLDGRIELQTIRESAYSDSGFAVEDDLENDKFQQVLIIS